MEKKTIYYVIGGIAVLGIGYYFYNKTKKAGSDSKNTENTQSENVLKEGGVEEQKRANEKIAEAKLAGRFTVSKEMSNALDRIQTAIGTVAQPIEEPIINTGIKGLKGKERGDFRKDTRATCEEKYGKGKDYRQCKRRVKDGGSPFEGDFEGMINSQFMFSEFENSLNLDL